MGYSSLIESLKRTGVELFIKVNRPDTAELSVQHYITDSQHLALPNHPFKPLRFNLVDQLLYRARCEDAPNLGVQYDRTQ